MTIITAEDDYQVVTIESKSEASTLGEFFEMCAGIAVALGYDSEQVAERMLDEREGEVAWSAAGFKPGEIIKCEYSGLSGKYVGNL